MRGLGLFDFVLFCHLMCGMMVGGQSADPFAQLSFSPDAMKPVGFCKSVVHHVDPASAGRDPRTRETTRELEIDHRWFMI